MNVILLGKSILEGSPPKRKPKSWLRLRATLATQPHSCLLNVIIPEEEPQRMAAIIYGSSFDLSHIVCTIPAWNSQTQKPGLLTMRFEPQDLIGSQRKSLISNILSSVSIEEERVGVTQLSYAIGQIRQYVDGLKQSQPSEEVKCMACRGEGQVIIDTEEKLEKGVGELTIVASASAKKFMSSNQFLDNGGSLGTTECHYCKGTGKVKR